jgi:hypothetical protein
LSVEFLVLSRFEIQFTLQDIRKTCSTDVENSLQIGLFFQNEPNFKDRSQNSEDGRQNKKMCISVCSIKDCTAILPANCLRCYQVIISGHQKNEAKRTQFRLAPRFTLGVEELKNQN